MGELGDDRGAEVCLSVVLVATGRAVCDGVSIVFSDESLVETCTDPPYSIAPRSGVPFR